MSNISRLIGNADEFPILRDWHFFNHAGVAPIPRCGGDALRTYAEQAESAAYVHAGWYAALEELRKATAKLINADPAEIALVKNTSEGIATVARGLTWRPGDRVITTAVEYPANIYPWMDVARREGAELIMISEEQGDDGRRRVPLEKILEAADHPRTRLVALSHVEYASGQRLDIARVGQFCRAKNILFCCDAIQTLGILPIDVRQMKIDFLAADGHKWLMGPEGAGIFYIRRDLLDQVHPPQIGWANVINAQDYGNYDLTLRPDAARYESGTPNVPGFLALKASMELLMSAGVDQIGERINALNDRLEKGLTEKGYQIISPRPSQSGTRHFSATAPTAADERSGSLVFISPKYDLKELVRKLRNDHHIEVALREGRIRCSPHFYNTESQIDHFINVLPH